VDAYIEYQIWKCIWYSSGSTTWIK